MGQRGSDEDPLTDMSNDALSEKGIAIWVCFVSGRAQENNLKLVKNVTSFFLLLGTCSRGKQRETRGQPLLSSSVELPAHSSPSSMPPVAVLFPFSYLLLWYLFVSE